MRKIRKAISLMIIGCLSMSTLLLGVNAANVPTAEHPYSAFPASIVAADHMPTPNNPVVIKVTDASPTVVTFPDGHQETFTLDTSGNARAATSRLSVTRMVSSPLTAVAGNAIITLWVDAKFENRSVALTHCGKGHTGSAAKVTYDFCDITVASASNNNSAKARVSGTADFYTAAIGDYAQRYFDHEIWIDPSNSSTAYLAINY